MLRGSVLLDADAKTGPVKWKVIGRLDREYKTNYLEDLEDLRATNGTAGGKSITENYNNGDIREFWAEIPIGDRITVKAGKQQLVWGESDFFQAMDLVHGYDYSWRLFFEGENEEWRKPLIMVSTKIRIPEAKGMIAAFVRPGWDRCEDIGNTYDIRGGRWFFQPYRGFDLSAVVMPVLETLSEETGESAAYYVEGGEPGQRLCLFRHQPHEGLHSQVLAGSVMPPDQSSTGRVFSIWTQGSPRGEDRLPFFSCGARDPYTSSWAVPIIGNDDRFVGALTIAGPSVRLKNVDAPHFQAIILARADELARRLGASSEMRDMLYGNMG